MVTETKRPKPSTINVADALGFLQQRLPETGQGAHKPNLGRGGLPLPSDYYTYGDKFEVPIKKGIGVGEKVKQAKTEKGKDTTLKWSEMI